MATTATRSTWRNPNVTTANNTILYYDQVAPPPEEQDHGAWIAYVVVWPIISIGGIVVGVFGKQLILGGIIVALITLVGVVWKPTFGLCLMIGSLSLTRVLPMGAGEGMFSLGRGVGILFLIGTAGHVLMTRKRFHAGHATTWALLVLAILSAASMAWSRWPIVSMTTSFTMLQLALLVILVITVYRNERPTFWPLRSFVLGCLLAASLFPFFGVSYSGGAEERFTLSFVEGKQTQGNTLAIIMAMGFFTAVYLFVRDPARKMRVLYVILMVVTPILIVLLGTRNAMISMAVTLLLPALLLRQVLQRPIILVGTVVMLLLLASVLYVGFEYVFSEGVVRRATDTRSAQRSLAGRLGFIKEAISYTASHPLGAGIGAWRSTSGHIPHNDFFYLLVGLGFPGAIVYGCLAVAMLLAVRRMVPGWEKWYARSIVVLLLCAGLGKNFTTTKHLWMFMAIAGMIAAQHSSKNLYYEEPLLFDESEGYE